MLLLSLGCSSATETNPVSNNNNKTTNTSNNPTVDAKLDNDSYDALLTKFVDVNGQVDYAGLKDDSQALRTFVSAIGTSDIDAFSTEQQLAFYINAYNALVLLEVIDQYPTESVMNIDNFFDEKKFKVAGKNYSLNTLENDLIRPTFKEPRIHFALVCAAKSCPPLQQKAYRAETLESDFQRVSKAFIEAQTTVDGKNITTSKIFDWFGEDFVESAGSVGQYLAIYLPTEKAALEASDAVFTFSEYSWALNEQ